MFRLLYDITGSPRAIGNAMKVPVTKAEAYTMGEALVITSGAATKCGATATPTHMCCRDQAADAAEYILVYPITGTMRFCVQVTAAPTALSVGSKVTLAADGLGVTATTTSGVCEIVDLNGAKAAGDEIVVKF